MICGPCSEIVSPLIIDCIYIETNGKESENNPNKWIKETRCLNETVENGSKRKMRYTWLEKENTGEKKWLALRLSVAACRLPLNSSRIECPHFRITEHKRKYAPKKNSVDISPPKCDSINTKYQNLSIGGWIIISTWL